MEYTFSTTPENSEQSAIAKITFKDKKKKGMLIYLNSDGQSEIDLKKDKVDLFYEFISEKSLRLSQKHLDELKSSIEQDDEPMTKQLKPIYEKFQIYHKENNELKSDDGTFEPLPIKLTKGKRDSIYLAGSSGSGKSYWISEYAKNFNQLLGTKAPIYFISSKKLKDEECYNSVKNIKQLSLDPEFLESIAADGNAFEHFASSHGSLVIFDDAEALSKKQQEYVDLILESILQIGRSKNIYCIISRHILNNGFKTKVIFNEINKLVVFPHGISRYNLEYCLKNYIGFDKQMIRKLFSLKSRSVLIHTHLPKYCIAEHNIILM